MPKSLIERLPSGDNSSADISNEDVLGFFLDHVRDAGLELYPAQEEAILELFDGKNVILNTPTGSGKSLVATALHFLSLAQGKRSFYTCPIKALVNEKFLALCRELGPDRVGMITGDAAVNPEAPVICCTAEILANDALREGAEANVSDVIMDEFHYYSDRERGVAWQVPLLTLKNARFLLMSATLGDTEFFEKELSSLNGRPTSVVRSAKRPVPLDFEYMEIPVHETAARLMREGKAPIYVVCFTQRETAEEAQNFLSVDFCTRDEKEAIWKSLEGVRFDSPYGKEIAKLLRHGIGIHHAGLLPRYRILVEKLAQKGLLKIICGTDTLGVGVNIPIRSVLFTKLCKFDGQKTAILNVRDFQQIAGRAGRKGFDDRGSVVVQAPEHVIENLRLEAKAGNDPKKLRKIVKRKPPEKGFVMWTKETFEKLVNGQPETLVSRFQVSHGMILNVLSRGDAGCDAMRDILRRCHETPNSRKRLGKTAFQLFRSLVERKIIEIKPSLRLNVDLQQDFSLHQALSLYLVDTIALLDPEHPEYALDLLTLVESILENPEVILRKQLDRVKTEKLAELKMQGMEYEERMAELENLEYPKPRREFIYQTFNEFAAKHPWVGQDNIRPKAIAREMVELFMSFEEYIRDYGLQRSEGILLRYLSEVYKVLVQTVPAPARNDEVESMIDYFGAMVRKVDSSLLDEWERLRNPQWTPPEESGDSVVPATYDLTRDRRRFLIEIRNTIFRLVRALAIRDYSAASLWTAEWGGIRSADEFEKAMAEFAAEHQRIRTDGPGRAPSNTIVRELKDEDAWEVHQILVDSEGHNDWELEFRVDLARSREAQKAVISLVRIGPA